MLCHFGDSTVTGWPFRTEMAAETHRPGISWSFDEVSRSCRLFIKEYATMPF